VTVGVGAVLVSIAMRIVFLIACCLGSLSVFAKNHSSAISRSPNVFLVTIDTLRADHIGCYGYKNIQTPALDGLARNGIRFAEAFTPTPITNTSHASILTGLLPSTHGVTDFGVPLTSAHATWAELLRDRGYHNAAFIGAAILDSRSLAPGLDRGFDFYDNFPQHHQSRASRGRLERRGIEVVARAERWLTAHPVGPHFVWIHLYDPHDPYEPPPPYSEIYKDHLYDGEIAYADSALGSFLDYIKKRGWYDNAILVLVGDHGEGLGEHGEDTHGIFLYDSTTHVPLILKLPKSAGAGRVVDAQVSTTDILPTVLDLLTISSPAKLDGVSMRTLFAQTNSSDRVLFGETDYPKDFGWAPLRSVRSEAFKFIDAPRAELYDLHDDPGELHNSYIPWDHRVQKARSLLADVRANLAAPLPSLSTVPRATVDELKALGYFGSSDIGSSTNVPEPSLLPDPKDKIEEANLLHRAMTALEDKPSEARIELEKVLHLDPKSPAALRQLGDLELNTGDYAKAAEHLKAALEARPNDAAAAFHEGQARQKLGDLEGARDALEESVKLTPGQLPVRLLLGEVYLELKELHSAREQFEAVSLLDSTNIQAKLGTARAEMMEGNPAVALDQLSSLSKSQRKNPEVFELLAQAYKNMGKRELAQQADARAKILRRLRHK